MILSIITKAFGIALILFGCAMGYIVILKRKMQQDKLSNTLKSQEIDELQESVIETVKEKIGQKRLLVPDKDDIKAKVLYGQFGVKELGEELKVAFNSKHIALSNKHTQLTDLDLLVIDLIIIGMDNDDICEIIHMEKRTLYRRRQLIAKRIGISSNDIEQFVNTL